MQLKLNNYKGLLFNLSPKVQTHSIYSYSFRQPNVSAAELSKYAQSGVCAQ